MCRKSRSFSISRYREIKALRPVHSMTASRIARKAVPSQKGVGTSANGGRVDKNALNNLATGLLSVSKSWAL